jgi:hypothetical protein
MKRLKTIKFRWPLWTLYTLLAFFVFSTWTPSRANQQNKRVQTEQRDEVSLRKVRPSVGLFHPKVSKVSFHPFVFDLASVLRFYSVSVHTIFKNQQTQCLHFTRCVLHLITHIHLLAEEPLAYA